MREAIVGWVQITGLRFGSADSSGNELRFLQFAVPEGRRFWRRAAAHRGRQITPDGPRI